MISAVDKLRILTNELALNRIALRSALIDLKAAVEGGKWTTFGGVISLFRPLLEKTDQATQTLFANVMDIPTKFFTAVTADIDAALSAVDSAGPDDDNKLRQIITQFYWPFMDFGILFGKVSSVLKLDPFGGLGWVSRLLETNTLGLDERWATATCYLTAMEIAVNRVAGSLRLADHPAEEFRDKFSKVLSVLEEKERPITGLKKQLPHIFWKLRNDVIHSGYSPTIQELDLVIPWVSETMKALGDEGLEGKQ